jgi:voltage-gated potassium channel
VTSEPGPWRRVLHSAGSLAAVLAVYYALPVGEDRSAHAQALAVAVLALGTVVLGWLIARQARRQLLTHDDTAVRIQSLVTLAYLVVVLFALGYFALARADAGEFSDLETKTDALYFTMSTLATVGYGDVHATGQLARGLVTLQIAFNLVFVAALASMVGDQLRRRAGAARDPHADPDADSR